jgi:Carboxypeptidase regulatory-like domain
MSSHARTILRTSALAFGLAAGLALAQSPVGTLAGRGLHGDVAVVTDHKTGRTREVAIGPKGRYQLRNLPVGRYVVVIRHADGRQEAPKPVNVHIGITTRVP